MDNSVNKLFLQVLDGQRTKSPPVWFMRQAGRYLPEYRKVRAQAGDFLDLCYTPDFAIEVTLQPIRRYHLDAAIIFADILLIPDALGQPLKFEEGIGPVLEPIRSRADFSSLTTMKIHKHLAPVYETVRGVREALPSDVTLIGFAGAPWTVATYMVGGRGSPDQGGAKTWAFEDSSAFGELIECLVEVTSEYLCAQVDAGAEVLQIFDTWAGSLPSEMFKRWCVDPTQKIIERVRDAGVKVPIIGFPRGCGPSYEAYVTQTGCTAVSIDTSLSVEWAGRHLQDKVPVQGNLDPYALVAGGETLETEVSRILEGFSGGPHIFNLGHGIVPQTPPEHVGAAVQMVRDWGG